jgi:hypothetical protein
MVIIINLVINLVKPKKKKEEDIIIDIDNKSNLDSKIIILENKSNLIEIKSNNNIEKPKKRITPQMI